MKRTLALILAIVLSLSLFAACSSGGDTNTDTTPAGDSGTTTTTPSGDQGGKEDGDTAPAPSSDGTNAPASEGKTSVTIGMVGTHDSSDPCSESSNDFVTQMMLYDKVMEIDDHTGERVFRILDSFEWTDDVTMKLVLRQDVYFANGDQATGEDLLYSFYSQVKGVDGSDKSRTDKMAVFRYIDFDKSYVDDDGYTVYIVWQQPYARAEPSLDVCLIQKKFVEEHPETDEIWYTDPLGTGPYKITDMQHDAYITFTRRDDYWDKDNYTYDAEQITLKFYSDETGMYVDYQNGVIDAMYNVSANIVEQVQSANTGVVNAVSNGSCAILWFNESNEFLSNAKVREAICYGIDMDAVGQIAFGSLYKKPHSFLPEGFEGYTEHEGYTYDLDRAQKALDESGYKGSDIKLHIVAMNDGTQPKIAETIQGYLSMLGITLDIETLDMGTALPKMLQRDGTDFQYFSKNGGNPTGELTALVAGNGKEAPFQCTAIYDEEYNKLCEEMTWTTDHEKTVKGCEEVDNWLYDNYYGIPVNDSQMALVYNPNVISSFDQCSILRGCLGSLTLA